jgi:hypothetical protein
MCYRQTLGRRFELGDLQEARIFCCWRRTFIHIKSASTSVRRSGGGGVCGGWGVVRSRASRRRAGGGLWRSSGIVFGAGKPKVRRRGGRALLTSRRPSARRTAMRLPVSASAPSPDCLVSCQRCSVGCRHAPPWTPPNHGIRGCDRISMCLCSTPWLSVSPELLISLLSCSTKHNKSRPWHSRAGLACPCGGVPCFDHAVFGAADQLVAVHRQARHLLCMAFEGVLACPCVLVFHTSIV